MSLKRLAVIAAISHVKGNANHNSTMNTTTTTTMSFAAANSAYNQNSGNSQIGGLGLLHQQNLRSGANVGVGGFSVGGISGGAPVMGGSSSGSSNPGGSNNINGNVNILLGGAMLSVVTTVLCVVCYCCHRNIKKRTEAAYRQRWMDNDANMEIYSVEQCYETSGLFMESSEGLAVPTLSHEPPPSYDAVVAMQEESQANRISPPPDYRSMNDVSGSSNANEIPKFIRGTTHHLQGMKKILSAQSCCSLQRAEAENLFQLGVAAAAATSGRFGVSALGRKSLLYAATACDSATIGEGRYVNRPYYRGCPLCGKFRYDDSMSLSSDSGLDQLVVAVDVSNGNAAVGVDKDTCYCTPVQSLSIDDRNNNVDEQQATAAVSHAIDDRGCTLEMCSSDASEACENLINNNESGVDDTPTAGAASTSTTSASSSLAMVTASTSDNSNHFETPTNTTDTTSMDLDSINDNGIIRLDMSKIIDKTGLPTYEAALKLESSGYV